MTANLDKYDLCIDDPSRIIHNRDSIFCGRITKQQVDSFIKALSKYDKIPETCCFGSLNARVLTKKWDSVLMTKSATDHFVNKSCAQLQIDIDKTMCKCADCLDNIKNGRCRDAFVRMVIGKILFSKMYAKQK